MTLKSLRRAAGATALLAAIVGTTPALALEVMNYVNLKNDPGKAPQIADVWKNQVSKTPSWGLAYRTYTYGNSSLTLMVGNEDACDNGANHNDSDQRYTTCPLHVVLTKDGKTTTQTIKGACYNDNFKAQPTAQDYVGSEFDPRTGALTIMTFQDGKAVPGCTKSLQVN